MKGNLIHMMKNNYKLKISSICDFILFLYFISISAYQLGTGFDAIFVRIIFIVLMFITIIINRKIILTKQIKWCLFFWGFYFLSMLWASNYKDTLYYVNNFIQILGIFICLPLIANNKEKIDKVLKLIVFSLVYTAILLIIRTPMNMWGTERMGAAIGLNPNALGLRLSIGVIICIYFLHNILKDKLYKKRKLFIVFYIGSLLLFIIVALFSGSKKALILIIFGMFTFEVFISKGWKTMVKIIIFSIIGFIILFTIFNNEKLYKVIGRRLEKTILTIQGDAATKDIDTSLVERKFYINQALFLFTKNPVVGYGGNNFMTYMREISYSHIAYSHNNYTELLATLGIVGFSIYYCFWGKLLVNLMINLKKYNSSNYLLFTILLMALLILDYANVSYVNEFNSTILCLAFLTIEKIKEEKE